jgi:hypothetical protein
MPVSQPPNGSQEGVEDWLYLGADILTIFDNLLVPRVNAFRRGGFFEEGTAFVHFRYLVRACLYARTSCEVGPEHY